MYCEVRGWLAFVCAKDVKASGGRRLGVLVRSWCVPAKCVPLGPVMVCLPLGPAMCVPLGTVMVCL